MGLREKGAKAVPRRDFVESGQLLRYGLLAFMRINRYFTDRGICSRREADRWIEEGRIAINGKTAKLGDQVEEGDEVSLDGKAIAEKEKLPILLAFNKPVGVECTSDPNVENNIIDVVNYPERIFHIGRLDKMSEGLILLTNMGEIVNRILRRRYAHEKEYVVAFNEIIEDAQIKELRRGVLLEDGKTAPCQVYRLGAQRIRIVLTEGRNRQIRRMAEAIGLRVVRLKRIRVMNIELGELPKGQWRRIEGPELRKLMSDLDKNTD
jgi:23S rRNA pseudouridine2604 synthase